MFPGLRKVVFRLLQYRTIYINGVYQTNNLLFSGVSILAESLVLVDEPKNKQKKITDSHLIQIE